MTLRNKIDKLIRVSQLKKYVKTGLRSQCSGLNEAPDGGVLRGGNTGTVRDVVEVTASGQRDCLNESLTLRLILYNKIKP